MWLDRAVDVSDRMIVPIQFYPFLDHLRGDSRYTEVLRKMRLTPIDAARCRPGIARVNQAETAG